MHTLTRQELFEAAWDRPLTKIAAELGVTSMALKKTCDRHLIPVPRRGYWAAVAGGKVFRRPKLKPVKDGRLEQILIRGATPAMTAAAAKRQARKALPEGEGHKAVEADEAAAPAARTAPSVSVPTRLRSPHRLVAAWIEEDRRRRGASGSLGDTGVSDEEAFIQNRSRLILDALFKVLEERGHRVGADWRLRNQGNLKVGRESLDFWLTPRLTIRREPLTAAEIANSSTGRRRYRQVREKTGELELILKDAFGQKEVWHDEGEQLLELRLGEVVLGIEDLAKAAAESRARRDEAERVRREEELRRYDRESQRRRDANQWKRLRELAQRDEEVQQVRRFLSRVRVQAEGEGGVDEELSAWFSWAEAWIDAWDPLAEGCDALLRGVRRVGEHDHRG